MNVTSDSLVSSQMRVAFFVAKPPILLAKWVGLLNLCGEWLGINKSLNAFVAGGCRSIFYSQDR